MFPVFLWRFLLSRTVVFCPHQKALGSTVQIELLGTTGCHLCEVAERMVRRIAPVLGFTLLYVDIAEDDALVDKYGMQIPVLRTQDGDELGWPFAEEELIHWLEAIKP